MGRMLEYLFDRMERKHRGTNEMENVNCPSCGSGFIGSQEDQYVCEQCGLKFSKKKQKVACHTFKRATDLNEFLEKNNIPVDNIISIVPSQFDISTNTATFFRVYYKV